MIAQPGVIVRSIRRIINEEHNYGWEVMPDPDAQDYGIKIFYYEPNKIGLVGIDKADADLTFSVAEARAIADALIDIANEIEQDK